MYPGLPCGVPNRDHSSGALNGAGSLAAGAGAVAVAGDDTVEAGAGAGRAGGAGGAGAGDGALLDCSGKLSFLSPC